MSEWLTVTLSELGPIVTGRTPPGGLKNSFGGDVPFITPSDFDGRRFIDQTDRALTPQGVMAVGGRTLPPRAVLVTCIGSDMGKVALSTARAVSNQQINAIAVEGENDPLFVYYHLAGRKAELRRLAGGSAQPILNKSAFGRLKIALPAPYIQRAISGVLASLDDKIEANRRMNESLEGIARALFKSWFVDFEPVRARVENRLVGLAPEIMALFPSALSDGVWGVQPQGWRVSKMGEEVSVIGGTTPSTASPEFWGGDFAWATPKDLSGLKEPVLLETERSLTAAGLTKVGSGLLPVNTVLLSSRAPIGYLAIAKVPMAINQGFVAMVCDRVLGPCFAYLWAGQNLDLIKSRANGSTFQEISKGSFKGIELVVPPAPVAECFEEIVRPMFDRIELNARQSRTLSSLRDLLLPKLMSGAIRVRDAEQQLLETL